MSVRRPAKAAGPLSPTLVLLITALEQQDAHSHDRPGEAQALRALGQLAVRQVPARGVLAPIESPLDLAIDEIAGQYLGFREARTALVRATSVVEPFAARDEILSAQNHLRSVSDRTQFYAGVAFGVTLVEFGAIR
jgi:hypothetical protein